MNKWFSEFLESLFQRAGTDRAMWLTAKQTAVCVERMDCKTVRYDARGYGTMYNHDNYYCKWDGRDVLLSYSKKNGCGRIEFGMNESEAEESKARYEEERRQEEIERIERIKNNPERLKRRIERITEKINRLREAWEDDKTYSDYSEDDEKYYSETMREYEAELMKFTA